MRCIHWILPVLIVLTGCRQDPASERLSSRAAPPAAALLAPGETADLRSTLRRLDAELAAAMEEADPDRLLRAEAMTDQLMEARREIDWLATGYDLEARLRQLQALADRVVARLRRGATLGEVEDDVTTIREAAQDLIGHLERPGGGEAPPRLEELLAQDPLEELQSRTARRAAASAAAQGQPAGEPAGQQATPEPAEPAEPAPAQPQPEPPPQPRPRPQQGPLGQPVSPPDSLRI